MNKADGIDLESLRVLCVGIEHFIGKDSADFVRLAADEIERRRVAAAGVNAGAPDLLTPMGATERPTEPGWYVVDGRWAHNAGRHVVEVAELSGVLGKIELHVVMPGQADPVWLSEFSFVARLSVDHIKPAAPAGVKAGAAMAEPAPAA